MLWLTKMGPPPGRKIMVRPLMNSSLCGKNYLSPSVYRKFSEKLLFHRICQKLFSNRLLLTFDFSESFPSTHQEFSGKSFSMDLVKNTLPRIYQSQNFFEDFNSILSTNQIARKQGRMSFDMRILYCTSMISLNSVPISPCENFIRLQIDHFSSLYKKVLIDTFGNNTH